MQWEDAVQRITEKANKIESALAHSTRMETLEALLSELQQDMQNCKSVILGAADGPSIYSQMESRARVLSRRVNIVKMAYQAEDSGAKMRQHSAGDCHISRGTEKLNKYIKIASHSLSSIEKQRSILKGSRQKLEDGLQYLGLSDKTIDRISNRYLSDYRLFKALTAVFILLFIYVFIFRGKK
ncbi:uncharacterized protein NEMAJ01_0236 [Nematocida major]|uniref:uncharacterized protein n=1 Tax=Nematocida major TaxID=1912982 RepID=UPI0020076E68|nr:uncharacterized protein NEMAJ01_0236 [Nematocida major]KAH9385340.1 hypothetical protein NEMAJ01_0236 [Nematocida major]